MLSYNEYPANFFTYGTKMFSQSTATFMSVHEFEHAYKCEKSAVAMKHPV